MKILIFATILFFGSLSSFAGQVKVLTVGNSFSRSVFKYLPQVAKSVAGCDLMLVGANISGCSLKQHWEYVLENEADSSAKRYADNTKSLKEILLSEKWDIITIQQLSADSWRPESFQPYAKNLCDYIKKHAPQAEIVIQQTWSYRSDDPRIRKGGEWNFDQNGMFERLDAAYGKLAREMNLRLIPMGLALQNARKLPQYRFVPYAESDYKKFVYPKVPNMRGSLIGYVEWRKNSKTKKMELKRDTTHLNDEGAYLQACVWFAFIFSDKKTSDINFTPKNISAKNAKDLRKVAQKTLNSRK